MKGTDILYGNLMFLGKINIHDQRAKNQFLCVCARARVCVCVCVHACMHACMYVYVLRVRCSHALSDLYMERLTVRTSVFRVPNVVI